MQKINLGIIGCGVMGKLMVRLANQLNNATVMAVADINRKAAQTVASEYGVTKIYDDPQALISDHKIDAVILELPTCERTKLALDAFGSGKHVLTEKPVAMNASEVHAMIQARGKLIGACFSSRLRFLESAAIIKKTILSGVLGQLRMIRIKGVFPIGTKPENPPVWRYSVKLNGGGLLMNWGCYDLDYIYWLLDWSCKPKKIWAKMWQCASECIDYIAPGSDGETHYVTHILCEDGVLINLERGEMICGLEENYCEIIGTKGGLRFRISPVKGKKIIFFEAEEKAGVVGKLLWEGDENWESAHKGPLEDFVNSILFKDQPATSLERALALQETIDKIYNSAKESRLIEA